MFAHWFEIVPPILVDLSIKILLLALVASVVMAVLRVRSSSWKHRVWSLVLLGMLLLPVLGQVLPVICVPASIYPQYHRGPVQHTVGLELTSPGAGQVSTSVRMPRAEVAAPPESQNGVARESQVVAIEGAFSLSAEPAVPSELQVEPIGRTQSSDWQPLLLIVISLVYVVGVIVLLGRIVVGLTLTRQLVRRARPIELPVGSEPIPQGSRVCESAEIVVPVTVGCWRPTILLPSDWHSWNLSLLRMVVLHEVEHIHRRDTWTSLAANITVALYWFHPITWILRRRLADLAEEIGDDQVIRATGKRADYAENLLAIAGRLSPRGQRLKLVGVAMARRAQVEKRIEAILDADRPLAAGLSRSAGVLLLLAVAPLVAIVAGLQASEISVPTVAIPLSGLDSPTPQPIRMALSGRSVRMREALLSDYGGTAKT